MKTVPQVKGRFYYPFEKIIKLLTDGFERYGDILQLKGFFVNVFCLRNPEHIEAIYRNPSSEGSKCPRVFFRLRWILPKALVNHPGGSEAKNMRKQIQDAFHGEFLTYYAKELVPMTTRMLEGWEKDGKDKGRFDIYKELTTLFAAYGLRIFFQKEVSTQELESLRIKMVTVETELSKRLPPLFLFPSDIRFRRYLRDIKSLVSKEIQKQKENPSQDPSFVKMVLNATEDSSMSPYSWDKVIDGVSEMFFSIMLATPPLSLGLRLLAKNKDVQEKLMKELDTVLKGRDPELKDLSQLKYLQMVTSEVLRIYPSTWGIPRYCKEGMEIDGYKIPAHSILISSVFHTHRNPNIFNDPLHFKPERFDPDNPDKAHSFARMAFGKGSRTCLGVHMATNMLQILMIKIFQRYHLSMDAASNSDPIRELEYAIHPKDPVFVKVQKRTSVLC